jgi:hypothetical protein
MGVPQRNLEILVNNVIEVVDENQDGEISIDEFTNTFLFERNRILDVIEDQMREIIDSDR